MTYKNVLYIALLNVTMMHGITLGPNLLKNSPIDYLIDQAKAFNDPHATLQIGQELCARDALYTLATHDHIVGNFYEQPVSPGYGYTPAQGMWIWIADTVSSVTGTWYWILKTHSYYIHFFSPQLGY